MKPLHSLLKRQLKKYFADTEHIPVELQGCIESVNDAYYQFDTDRNMLERSLELSSNEMLQINAEMRAVFQAFPDFFFWLDSEDRILDCKGGHSSDIYLPPEKMIGRSIQDSPHEHIRDSLRESIQSVRETRSIASTEYSLSINNNEYFFEARMLPLLEDQIIMIVRDITERKRAEQEQERLNAELSQKNTELERVVYVTSHDLRTPLVNIQGFNKELGISVNELFSSLQKSGLPEKIKEEIAPIVENDIPDSQNYIARSITKMDSLLTGLLKLSRLGSSELNVVKLDMNRLVSDVITILRTQSIKAGAKITVSKLPSCHGDESQISQLFANLAGNAVKFLNPDQPGIINITGYKDNNQSVYCVEDNGIGIEADYQEKIFDIFHRLNPSEFKGEGLGLSIVNRAIERHGGKIWVESDPGKGSRFFVSLPDTKKRVSSEAGRQEN